MYFPDRTHLPEPGRHAARRRPARSRRGLHRGEPAAARDPGGAPRPAGRTRPRRHRRAVRGVSRSRPTGCARSPTRSRRRAPTTYDKVLAIEQWLGTHTEVLARHPPPAEGRRRGRPVRVRRPQGLLRADRHHARGDAARARHPRPARGRVHARRAQPVHRPLRGEGERRPRLGRGVLPRASAGRASTPPPSVPLAGDSQIDAAGDRRVQLPQRAARTSRASCSSASPSRPASSGSASRCGRSGGGPARWRCRGRGRRNGWPASRRSGAHAGRPRAPSETTPNYVRALGAIAPGQDDALGRVGADDRRGDVRARARPTGPSSTRSTRCSARIEAGLVRRHEPGRPRPEPLSRRGAARSGDGHALEHRDLHAPRRELGEERARARRPGRARARPGGAPPVPAARRRARRR